jgi:hypothetical protein
MILIRPLGLLAACLFVSLASPVSAAGPHGYSIVDGELLYFDLSDGSFEVIGPTGVDGFNIEALTDGPGSFIYGIRPSASLESELYRFDVTSGQGELIGSLETPNGAQDPQNTLALLPDGFLYASNFEGNLYRIDPDTAETTLILELGLTWIMSISAIESQLYVFYLSNPGCGYGRVDLQTLTFEPLGTHHAACAGTAAVTSRGKIILATVAVNIVDPTFEVSVIEFDLTNPADSLNIGSWLGDFTDPSTKPLGGLARVQGTQVVDVPTSTLLGRLLFVAGLALAAFFALHTANVIRN